MGQKSDKNVKSRADLEAELKRRSLSEIVSGCESSMRRYLYHYYNQETILLHHQRLKSSTEMATWLKERVPSVEIKHSDWSRKKKPSHDSLFPTSDWRDQFPDHRMNNFLIKAKDRKPILNSF